MTSVHWRASTGVRWTAKQAEPWLGSLRQVQMGLCPDLKRHLPSGPQYSLSTKADAYAGLVTLTAE
jgi:hypothetical protein